MCVCVCVDFLAGWGFGGVDVSRRCGCFEEEEEDALQAGPSSTSEKVF